MAVTQLAPEHTLQDADVSHEFTRRAFLTGAGAAMVGVTLYAGTYGRHQLVVRHRTIAIRDLPDAFIGMRLAQISDIHLQEFTEPA